MIRNVHKVVVAVDDQDRAKEFWTSKAGFEVVQDTPYGTDGRWLEITPPDRGVILVLSPRPSNELRRVVPEELPHSDVLFGCDDIHATHRELVARGVRFHTAPIAMPFGWWAMFEDPEGMRFALGQWK
jgi:lactoylglutathione lyase